MQTEGTRRRRSEAWQEPAAQEPEQSRPPKETRDPSPKPPKRKRSIREMYGCSCRRCINFEFSIHLEPKDVKYIMQNGQAIMDRCQFCGRNGHIVKGARISGMLKILTRRR